MRRSLVVLGCVAAVACQRTETVNASGPKKTVERVVKGDAKHARVDLTVQPMPIFFDHALIGSDVGSDGNVTKESTAFTRGQTVYLTMYFTQSPRGLRSQAVWSEEFRAGRKLIRRDEHDMNGAKVVTFSFKTDKLKPGVYRVEGFWGGNIATDKQFMVQMPSRKARS